MGEKRSNGRLYVKDLETGNYVRFDGLAEFSLTESDEEEVKKMCLATLYIKANTTAWQDFVSILIINGYGVEIIPTEGDKLMVSIIEKEEK